MSIIKRIASEDYVDEKVAINTPVKGTDYWTDADKAEMVEEVGKQYIGRVFDKFPTEEEINALENWSYFRTKGLYYENDGLGSVYQVKNSSGNFYVPYGNMYFRPVEVDWNYPDINIDLYGIRRGSADYAQRNSEIMASLASTLQNGFTLHFASGHYYFAEAIPHIEKHIVFKGSADNSLVNVRDVNYGTYLHFPNLADGEAAISLAGGVVQDIGIIGNPNVCDISFDRTKTYTAPESVITLVDTGTTYGIKLGAWGYTIKNVRILNCTYGIYTETSNALISHVDIRKCKIGISVGHDIKINTVKLFNVMTGIQLRGLLASATNIRGDSIGKHLIECWEGKCTLSDIDGDYCVGSLIHYGDGTERYLHLGQATGCMGRVAAKCTYTRSEGFDLSTVSADDYEYCSYISIAHGCRVFGGLLDVVNVSSNILDTASEYVHPCAVLSIGRNTTVMGLSVRCSLPHDADIDYFNKNVVKSLSATAVSVNDTTGYITNFDGNTIEDISFIAQSGTLRSMRTVLEPDRKIESLDFAVRFTEQELTNGQKEMARENIGCNTPSLEFVADTDGCNDIRKTYVLPDGTLYGHVSTIEFHYTNQLPIAVDTDGTVFNGVGFVRDMKTTASGLIANKGSCVSGYIPAKAKDVLRFKNMEYLDVSGDTTGFNTTFFMYDASFNKIEHANHTLSSLPGSDFKAVYGDNGDVIQMSVPDWSSNIAYIRLCCGDLNSGSIITVNEEIIDPTVTTTWQKSGYQLISEDDYIRLKSLEAEFEILPESIDAAVDEAIIQAKENGDFNGTNGYTPVKGTDYWTEADKNEIKSYVDDAILGGVW